MRNKIFLVLLFIFLLPISFLDINNHLNFGPKDQNGFTPLDHGILGTLVKLMLVTVTCYTLYILISLFIKRKSLVIMLTIVGIAALLITGGLLSFSLYYTF